MWKKLRNHWLMLKVAKDYVMGPEGKKLLPKSFKTSMTDCPTTSMMINNWINKNYKREIAEMDKLDDGLRVKVEAQGQMQTLAAMSQDNLPTFNIKRLPDLNEILNDKQYEYRKIPKSDTNNLAPPMKWATSPLKRCQDMQPKRKSLLDDHPSNDAAGNASSALSALLALAAFKGK